MKLIKLFQRIFLDDIYPCICRSKAYWYRFNKRSTELHCNGCDRVVSARRKLEAIGE